MDSGEAGGVRTLDFQNHNRITRTLKGTEGPLPVQNSKIRSSADTDGNGLISYNKLHYPNPAACRRTMDSLKTVSDNRLASTD